MKDTSGEKVEILELEDKINKKQKNKRKTRKKKVFKIKQWSDIMLNKTEKTQISLQSLNYIKNTYIFVYRKRRQERKFKMLISLHGGNYGLL